MDKTLKQVNLNPVNLADVAYCPKTGLPIKENGNIDQTIICIRPNITGAPKIYSEERNGKIITHNYGHGGAGWSVIWGCVEKSVELFNAKAAATNMSKQTPITVIGAGCMGLYTAITLSEQGYQNIEIVAEKLEGTPSQYAGGYFAIVSVDVSSPAEAKQIEEVCARSYRVYEDIVDGRHPVLNRGCRRIYVYVGAGGEVGALNTVSGLEEYAASGVLPPPEECMVNFGSVKHRMRRYLTFFVNPSQVMKDFVYILEKKGIRINFQKVNSFDEVRNKVIFNCTGIGARELNNDNSVYPVLGHLITLRRQNVERMDYLIYTQFSSTPCKTPEEKKKAPYIYYMPKNGGVVGGTFLKNYLGENTETNAREFKSIIDRCRAFFGTGPQPKLQEK